MAFYGTITDVGRAFEACLKSEGRPLIFQRVSGGSGLTSDPATATDLMNERCAFFLKYSEPIDDRIEIYTTLDNNTVSESFLWQQWGLWVGDGEGAEVLYLLSQEANGQAIDPGTDIIDYKHTIILSGDAEVTVVANPIGPVTQGDIGRVFGVAPLDGEAKVPVEHLAEIGSNTVLESNGQSVEANQRRQDGEIEALQVEKAPLASPTLTGIPTAPTPTAASASSQIATKEYVDDAVYGISVRSPVNVINFNQLSYLANSNIPVSFSSVTTGAPSGLENGVMYYGLLHTESYDSMNPDIAHGAYQTLSVPVLRKTFYRWCYVGRMDDWPDWGEMRAVR